MSINNTYLTIKGTKDGLVFKLDDTCSFADLLQEMKEKLDVSYQHFLEGPSIGVTVQLGNRYLTPEQEQIVRDMIDSKGNLNVVRFESNVVLKDEVEKARREAETTIVQKTVRSGQVLEYEGNVLILGDINPGGCVRSTGSIFVIGALRGVAHAGMEGNKEAIIAASLLQPTQLRIASSVSRPPDEWKKELYEMEFAYIEEDHILVEKIYHLSKLRPNSSR